MCNYGIFVSIKQPIYLKLSSFPKLKVKCTTFNSRTREEKDEWLEALLGAVKDLYQRKSSLKVWNGDSSSSDGGEFNKGSGEQIFSTAFPSSSSNKRGSSLGRIPPRLLRPEAASRCMAECGQPFSMMRKRHSCRACGIVSFFLSFF